MTKEVLASYWEVLGPKHRRLIYDLLKSDRPNLTMGTLPFVPVKEVIHLLKQAPMSPWTDALFTEEFEGARWYRYSQGNEYARYSKSKAWDKKIYAEIIDILTPQLPERPTQIAAQLEQWKERNSKGQE